MAYGDDPLDLLREPYRFRTGDGDAPTTPMTPWGKFVAIAQARAYGQALRVGSRGTFYLHTETMNADPYQRLGVTVEDLGERRPWALNLASTLPALFPTLQDVIADILAKNAIGAAALGIPGE